VDGCCDVPLALANGSLEVVSVAAGPARSAAVLADGSVIGWPDAITPTAPVAELRFLDYWDTVALTQAGTVEVIEGWSPPGAVPQSNDIVAVDRGIALHTDGTVTIWQGYGASNHGTDPEPVTVDIASTADHLVMLRDDGSVRESFNDQVPADLPPAVAVAAGKGAGGTFSLALSLDGEVRAWGANGAGQCDVPAGLDNVVAIAAGEDSSAGHVLALQKSGQVVAWGDNGFGQCNVPSDLGAVVAVAAGWRHSAALLANGTVRVWGSNYYGEHNVPAGLDRVIAISSRNNHLLALRSDGTVRAWGSNDHGRCDVPAGLSDVVAIDAGPYRSLALRSDGTVAAWGENSYGGCDVANAMTGVIKISGGGYFSSDPDSFLVAAEPPSIEGTGPYAIPRKPPGSAAVCEQFKIVCQCVLDEFDLDLNDSALELTAAKELIQAVVSLGLPHTLKTDDALRGFLLGDEPIPEKVSARALYASEVAWLDSSLWARPRDLPAMLQGRIDVFSARLYEALNRTRDLGEPEIPRALRHTLASLRVLRAAHRNGDTPLPVFESIPSPGTAIFALYGEPYVRYSIDESTNLSAWTVRDANFRDGGTLIYEASTSPPRAFYSARLSDSP
jgi:hypothetical protein